LTSGRLFRDADRDDGRKLVTFLFEVKKNKRATVQKKVGHLAAAVNLAMAEGKLRFNPFSSIIPNIEDAEKREPMPEEDMGLIRENRHTFDREEWLLYLLCATTGMRREEAYAINREYVEQGIRYVIIRYGKTKQSERRVPLPDAVLPLLPPRITRPLFTKNLKNLGREILRQMERIGVTKPGLHSLRHRAKDP
jgi:integrase